MGLRFKENSLTNKSAILLERGNKMNKDEVIEDIKKLLGIKPYNGATNFLIGDGYFSKSIQEKCLKQGLDYNKILREVQDEN